MKKDAQTNKKRKPFFLNLHCSITLASTSQCLGLSLANATDPRREKSKTLSSNN